MACVGLDRDSTGVKSSAKAQGRGHEAMTSESDRLCRTPRAGMARLFEIMRRLRDPQTGCPWDLVQTFATIAPHTIEEAHEVGDAIEREAWDDVRDELGDLLFQIVYHATLAREQGLFDFESIVDGVADKMVDRHPHVFGGQSRDKSAARQARDWEIAKAAERKARGADGALDDVALGLPALVRASKLQKRAARVGFDGADTEGVLANLSGQAEELARARQGAHPDAIEGQMGDLLFSMVTLARHLGVDAEAALRRANATFTRRFRALERALADIGRTPHDASLDEMNALWDEAVQTGPAGQTRAG